MSKVYNARTIPFVRGPILNLDTFGLSPSNKYPDGIFCLELTSNNSIFFLRNTKKIEGFDVQRQNLRFYMPVHLLYSEFRSTGNVFYLINRKSARNDIKIIRTEGYLCCSNSVVISANELEPLSPFDFYISSGLYEKLIKSTCVQ